MEFKGTKGKWKVSCFIDSGKRAKINNGNIEVWALHDVSVEQANANALLISKAPEMLEFIQAISKSENTPIAYRKIAQKLIKEATEI